MGSGQNTFLTFIKFSEMRRLHELLSYSISFLLLSADISLTCNRPLSAADIADRGLAAYKHNTTSENQ